MKEICEAAVQERTGWGFFHRCKSRAMFNGTTYLGETIRVCGTHRRASGSLIKHQPRRAANV